MGYRAFALSLLLAVILVTLGCQTGQFLDGTVESMPEDSGQQPTQVALPLPSALHTVSSLETGTFLYGATIRLDLPSLHTSPFGDTGLGYEPDYNRAPGSEPAYAFYSFDITGATHDSQFNFEWTLSRNYSDAWIGIANHTTDTWDWVNLPTGNTISFIEGAHADAGIITIVVAVTGTQSWILDNIWIGPAKPTAIDSVTPIHGHNGQVVTFNAVLKAAAGTPDTWDWNFGAAAVPATSTDASPEVTLQDPGVYNASVTVSNALSDSTFNFSLCIRHSSESWEIHAFSGGLGPMVDTSIDLGHSPDEHPHIAYAFDDLLHYKKFDGLKWRGEPVAITFYPIEFTNTGFALSSTDQPYFTYAKGNEYVKYLTHTGDAWVNGVIDGGSSPLSATRFYMPRIAIDSLDNVHVSYEMAEWDDDYNADFVMYSVYDGADWSTPLDVADSGGVLDTGTIEPVVPLALTSTDAPRIAYYDDDPQDVMLAAKDSGWSTEQIDISHVAGMISIDIDSLDRVHAVYEVSGGAPLYYARYNGTDWDVEPIAGTEPALDYISLKLDSSDNPHVAYYDAVDDDLRLAYYDGGWHDILIEGYGETGTCCSLVLDSNDLARISYYDATTDYIKCAFEPVP